MDEQPILSKANWNLEGAVVITVLLSIVSLAFSAGIEFNKIANLKSHQIEQDASYSVLRGQVLSIQTTLPVQMAQIQTKLDDISSQLKERRHAN